MFNNGNNGGGNPNHASDGKFTSGANQAGNKVEKKENYESQVKEKLGIKNDTDPSYEEKMQNIMGIKKAEMPKKKFLISDSEGSLISEEPIEASSEEEAFEIASQMFPGRGDELFVNEDVEEEKATPNYDDQVVSDVASHFDWKTSDGSNPSDFLSKLITDKNDLNRLLELRDKYIKEGAITQDELTEYDSIVLKYRNKSNNYENQVKEKMGVK